MTGQTPTAKELHGKWVRMKADGRPFKVWMLGRKERSGKQRIYGPVECCWPEDVEALTPDEEIKAREEWERNVR